METMLIKWLYLYKVSNSYIIAFFEDENWGRFVFFLLFCAVVVVAVEAGEFCAFDG